MDTKSSVAHICVLDDDERICKALQRYLENEGYIVHSLHKPEQIPDLFDKYPISLLLLDLNLPGTHGFEVARDVLSSKEVGIIMITGGSEPIDKIVGLELGADDFLQKPFDFRELLARVRSVLRRVEKAHTRVAENTDDAWGDLRTATFGKWTLNTLTQDLTDGEGSKQPLTSHEFSILVVFLQSKNRVLSRDAILDSTANRSWTPYDRSVDVLISKLRRKLQSETDDESYITTIRGQGYKFSIPVHWTETKPPQDTQLYHAESNA